MEQKTKHNTLLNVIILFFIVVFGIGAVAFMAKLFNEFTLSNFLGTFICISIVGLLFLAEYKSFRVLNGEDAKETKEIYLSGVARLIPYMIIVVVTIINYQLIKILPNLEKYNLDFFIGSLVLSLVFLIFHLFIGTNEKEYSFSTKRTTYIIIVNNKFWFLSFKSWSKLIVAVGFSALTLGVLSSINSFYGNLTWPITFLYIYIAFFSYFREKREEYKHLRFQDIPVIALEKIKIYWIAIRNIFVGEPTVSLYEVKRFLFLASVISLISSAIIDSSSRFSPETKEWIKSVDVGILTCYLIVMFLFQKSFKNTFQKNKLLKIILLIVAVFFILPLGTIGFSVVAVGLGIYLYRKDKKQNEEPSGKKEEEKVKKEFNRNDPKYDKFRQRKETVNRYFEQNKDAFREYGTHALVMDGISFIEKPYGITLQPLYQTEQQFIRFIRNHYSIDPICWENMGIIYWKFHYKGNPVELCFLGNKHNTCLETKNHYSWFIRIQEENLIFAKDFSENFINKKRVIRRIRHKNNKFQIQFKLDELNPASFLGLALYYKEY